MPNRASRSSPAAADGLEALELARQVSPDVCLLDIRMPRLDGVETTRRMAELPNPPAVVVITTFDTDENIANALRAGARGFLLKDSGPQLLAAAIRAAAEGDALIAPAITARLLRTFARSTPKRQEPIVALTAREEK